MFPSVFEPDFSRKKKKSGLGLAIVHKIIKDHGGSIRVEQNAPRVRALSLNLPVRKRVTYSAGNQRTYMHEMEDLYFGYSINDSDRIIVVFALVKLFGFLGRLGIKQISPRRNLIRKKA